MVLAHGEHFNVLDHHHFVMILVENGAIKNVCQEIKGNVKENKKKISLSMTPT